MNGMQRHAARICSANIAMLQPVILNRILRRDEVEASFVESKIEALVQADFEIASEIAGARNLRPYSYRSHEIESTWFHLDVLAALRHRLQCWLLRLRIVPELYMSRPKP